MQPGPPFLLYPAIFVTKTGVRVCRPAPAALPALRLRRCGASCEGLAARAGGPGRGAAPRRCWEGEVSVGCLCFGVGALQAYSVSEVWGESCPCSAEERCLAGSSSDPRRCLCFGDFSPPPRFRFPPSRRAHLQRWLFSSACLCVCETRYGSFRPGLVYVGRLALQSLLFPSICHEWSKSSSRKN